MNSVECIDRKYSGLSRQDLQKHIRFCSRVLAADSSAHAVLPNAGIIPIWKRKFKTKPDCLELQISAGHLERSVVETAAAELEARGINFKSRFTKKRGALSRITISHEVGDTFTPKAIADIIVSVSKIVDPITENFSMEYWSNFEKECEVEEGDPVTFGLAYKLSHLIGHTMGVAARLFKQ